MNDEAQISEAEARANFQKWKGILNGLKKNKTTRKDQAVKLANELSSFTENILAAQKAYLEKGFEVTIETSQETGLVTKWKLKNKYPKRNRVVGGDINNVQSDPPLKVEEFNRIVNLLPDVEFGSKNIQEALEKGGIGKRKLQPTLGNILNGMFGKSLVERVNKDSRGPGVRYRKVK
jgi:hypothetical protein